MKKLFEKRKSEHIIKKRKIKRKGNKKLRKKGV